MNATASRNESCAVSRGRRRTAGALSVLVALLVSAAALAAPTVTTLDNGLQVCLAEDNSTDLVAVALLVEATADCEPDAKVGLRAVLQQAIRGGLNERAQAGPDLAFLLDAQDGGGELSADCDWEYVTFGYLGAADSLPAALPALAAAMFQPELTEAQFTAARDAVLAAVSGPASAPAESTIALFRLALLGRPSRAYPLGTPETVGGLSLADLNAFHRRFYAPARATLAVVGPIDLPQTRQLAARCFGSLPAGDRTLPDPPDMASAPQVRVAENAELTPGDHRHADIASLVVGVPAPGLGDPDQAVSYVAHALLGGETATEGRVGQDDRLWETLGLPFSKADAQSRKFVESLAPPLSRRSHLAIHAYAAPRQSEAVKEALRDQLQRLATDPPGDKELQAAKQYVEGHLSALYDRPANRALLMARACLLGQADLTGDALTRQVLGVTPQDVQRVAKAWFAQPSVALELPQP